MNTNAVSIEDAYKSVEDKLGEARRLGADGFTITKHEADALLDEIDKLRKKLSSARRRLSDIDLFVKKFQAELE